MSRMRRMLGAGPLLAVLPGLVYAEEWQIVGARYQGLGGAGVAIAFEADAADWNPGTLALASRTEEVSLRGGVALAAEGDFLDHAGRIVDFVDETRIDTSIRKLRDGGALDEGELRDALTLFVDQAPELQPDGQGAQVLGDTGVVLRRGRWVLTGRAFGFAGLDPRFDVRSFALGADGEIDVSQLVGGGQDRSGEFSNPGSASLAQALAQANVGLSDAQAEELVFQAEQAGIDTSSAKTRDLLVDLVDGGGSSSGGSSGVLIRGLYVKQFGIAGGIPLIDGVLGVGAHLKYMHGTTHYEFVGLDASGDTEHAVHSPRRRSRDWGLDVGVLYRPTDTVRLGLAVRNLNGPSFKTVNSRDPIRLRPQVRAGVALQLHPRVQFAADLDLTKNDFQTIAGLESRTFSTGLEYRTAFRKWSVDLRGGAQRKLNRGRADDLTLCLGFGLHLRASRFDFALSYGLGGKRVERIDAKLPRRAELSSSLRWIWEY